MKYFEPRSVAEAVAILGEVERARLVAGGTDVVVDLKYRSEQPAALVNIRRMPGLSYIGDDGTSLRVGALTTIAALEADQRVRQRLPVLWEAAHQFASLQVRNMATIGGNVGRASPAGDTLAPLMVLEARTLALFPEGERVVPFNRLFLSPGRTELGTTGFLREIEIPWPPPGSRSVYLKHAIRGAMDIALLGVAVMIVPASDRRGASEVRLAIAAAAPTPIRAPRAEALLAGRELRAELLAAAAAQAAAEARPISDHRASADYKRWIVEALVRRGLEAASQAIGGAS